MGAPALGRYAPFLFALGAAASFAAMAACVRVVAEALPLAEVLFLRNALSLLLLAPLLIRRGVSWRTKRLHLHLLRALSGLAAMALYFFAIHHLPLADAILLNYTSPLFVVIAAYFWLHERPSREALLALALGFAGVGVLFHPSSAVASLAGAAGLGSGILAGIALTAVKRLAQTEPPERIVAYFALIATLASLPFAATGFSVPSVQLLPFVLGLGLFGTLGQLAMTRAYELGRASHVAPVGYTSLIFAAWIGWIAWDEALDAVHWLGAALIAAAGWLVRRPAPAPPSATPAARW